MTIRNLIQQINRSIGDGSGGSASVESALSALTEEMRYACRVFPLHVKVTATPANGIISAASLGNITPKMVHVGSYRASKIRAYEMDLVESGIYHPSGYVYSMMEGDLHVSPDTGEVTIYGALRNPEYVLDDLDKEFAQTASPGSTEVTGHTEEPLTIVRYRVACRLAEELGDMQKAQYFMAVADKKEREVRVSWDDDTTMSTGLMRGDVELE